MARFTDRTIPSYQDRILASRLKSMQTRAEELLWHCLRANRLDGYHFRRQQPILGFIADFYCHKVRLIVEVDGEIHNQLTERDHQRAIVLECNGYHVIRFMNDEVYYSRDSVLARIRRKVKELESRLES